MYYQSCFLHTYFFLILYAILRWNKAANYTKFGLRNKMVVWALILFLLWDCDLGLFWFIHAAFFGTSPDDAAGAPYGKLWEFYFRTHLHHWSSFVGMVFAINYPITSLFIRKLEAFGTTKQILSKGVIAATLLGSTVMWAIGPFNAPKFTYNLTHPYFGFLPILCFIFFLLI